MRKLLLLASCLLLSACGDSTSPEDIIAVSVAAAPNTIRTGDPMELDIAITNTSDDEHTLLTDCQQMFEVRTAQGTIVGPGPIVCSLALVAPVTIEPNSTLHYRPTWSGESTTTTSTGEPVYLPAGTYFIWPRVGISSVGTVYGTPIQVTITQ
jgi:hypothetical protein